MEQPACRCGSQEGQGLALQVSTRSGGRPGRRPLEEPWPVSSGDTGTSERCEKSVWHWEHTVGNISSGQGHLPTSPGTAPTPQRLPPSWGRGGAPAGGGRVRVPGLKVFPVQEGKWRTRIPIVQDDVKDCRTF